MASIIERNGHYFIMVSGGYDSNGKQIRHTMTYSPQEGLSEKQVQKKLNEQAVLFERKVRSGKVLDGGITLKEFSERWVREYGESQLAPQTLSANKHMLKRILPNIGHIRLDKLQPHHLSELYAKLGTERNRKGLSYIPTPLFMEKIKGITQAEISKRSGVCLVALSEVYKRKAISEQSALKLCKVFKVKMKEGFILSRPARFLSSNTIKKHHRLLSAILQRAVYWQLIPDNPARRVQPPKTKRFEAKYLDEVQCGRLLELMDDQPIQQKTMIRLLIFSGMRRGELCGLEWKDIDYDNNMISIERTSQYLPNFGIYTKDTKTVSSKRKIKLPGHVFQMLREYKAWQNQLRLRMGDLWTDTDRLFIQDNGKAIHPDSITKWFSKFIKQTDLPQISIHSLRHTNVTLLIAGGIPLTTVAKRVGHCDSTTTTRIYAHAIRTMDEMASEVLDDMLTVKKKSQ